MRVDRLGFDSVGIADRYYYSPQPWSNDGIIEASTLLTAIAVRTESVTPGNYVLAATFPSWQ